MNNKETELYKIADIVVECCANHIGGRLSFSREDLIGKCRKEELVMVIGLATSGAEFFDSVQHEIGHLATHIALEDGIDLKGEEVRYIQGDFARSLYPYIKDLLCECCRKKQHL